MLKTVLSVLLVIVMASSILFFSFAEEKKEKEEKEKQEAVESEAIVSYELIQQGTYSGLREPLTQIINDAKEWEAIWKKHVSMLVPQPPLPEIDFNAYTVVVLATGEKNTSGYNVIVKDISFEGEDIVVKYVLTEPPPSSFTLQVLTQPYLMMKVQKPKGAIKLIKE